MHIVNRFSLCTAICRIYQGCLCAIKKLEIWGKAQRESARRPKSNWGKLKGG